MADIRNRLKAIWAKYRFAISLALLIVGIIAGRAIYAPQTWELGMNLFTEAMSIGVTVLILDELNRRRDERNAEAALKRQLVRDAASQSNEKAKDAVYQLRINGWLTNENGLLRGSRLFRANLHNADLSEANLQQTDLALANLNEVDLRFANLQQADLTGAKMYKAVLSSTNFQSATLSNTIMENAYLFDAKMEKAELEFANMQKADLSYAYLAGANLRGAELQGANLRWSDLQGANLYGASFNTATILPDGEYWSQEPKTDMRRFTDPTHPYFFPPDW